MDPARHLTKNRGKSRSEPKKIQIGEKNPSSKICLFITYRDNEFDNSYMNRGGENPSLRTIPITGKYIRYIILRSHTMRREKKKKKKERSQARISHIASWEFPIISTPAYNKRHLNDFHPAWNFSQHEKPKSRRNKNRANQDQKRKKPDRRENYSRELLFITYRDKSVR